MAHITRHKEKKKDEEIKADISVIKLDGPEEIKQLLKKVVSILEVSQSKELEQKTQETFADIVDKVFFGFYFTFSFVYICVMTCVMVWYKCEIDHFGFLSHKNWTQCYWI